MAERLYTDEKILKKMLDYLDYEIEEAKRERILLQGKIEHAETTRANLKGWLEAMTK